MSKPRADLLRSLAELRSSDNETELSLAQDYKTLVDAVERVKIDEERLQAAALRAEIAEKQYRNGLISFQDFETITNDYINLQRTALTSRRDAVIAEANWEQSQGKGVLP
ncbi:MAG: TolC family protein [Verrucomicrobiia bacterium]